jgi:O-antigen biosynthesis protein WbqP
MPNFRPMKRDTPELASHLLNEPETLLTPIGHSLRKYSLDEIPQLWSILIGQMSFVGPRPALFNQYDLISLRSKYKVDRVLPGLTGWAQVNGRDELPIDEKVEKDVEYLENYSFLFDLKIIWLTIIGVIKKDGVSH